jgi:hypothetical protein
MITQIDDRYRTPAPLQPMGWASNAYRNAAAQQRQEAEAQRRRADKLAARNRALQALTAWLLVAVIGVGAALGLLGLVLGYAIGVGLIGLVRP